MQNVYSSKVLHVMTLGTLFLCAVLPSLAGAEEDVSSIVAADSEAVVSGATVQDDEIPAADTATAVTAAGDKTANKAEVVAEEIAIEVETPASQVEEKTAAAENVAAEVSEPAEENSSVIPDFIRGHLQIGTRSVYRTLTDDDSGHKGGTYGTGTYLGTIYALDEDQDLVPLQFYLTYFFNDYVGVEFAYDQMEAETVATNGYTMAIKTDGNVSLAGPTISVIGRYKNETPVTPFIGVGAGFFSGDFDATSTWAYTASSGAYRYMNVDDVTALLLTAGAEWEFVEHWMLNLSLQYVSADVDAEFDGYINGVQYAAQTGHFPMDNIAFRLGIAYQF